MRPTDPWGRYEIGTVRVLGRLNSQEPHSLMGDILRRPEWPLTGIPGVLQGSVGSGESPVGSMRAAAGVDVDENRRRGSSEHAPLCDRPRFQAPGPGPGLKSQGRHGAREAADTPERQSVGETHHWNFPWHVPHVPFLPSRGFLISAPSDSYSSFPTPSSSRASFSLFFSPPSSRELRLQPSTVLRTPYSVAPPQAPLPTPPSFHRFCPLPSHASVTDNKVFCLFRRHAAPHSGDCCARCVQ